MRIANPQTFPYVKFFKAKVSTLKYFRIYGNCNIVRRLVEHVKKKFTETSFISQEPIELFPDAIRGSTGKNGPHENSSLRKWACPEITCDTPVCELEKMVV